MRKSPSISRGDRIYAIGDIHGRLDLFVTLIERIREDAARRPARRTRLILIGDVVDRGPSSAELVNHLMRLGRQTDQLIVLRGNHEQVMIEALRGDLEALQGWLQFGGDETLKSWGVSGKIIDGPLEDLYRAASISIGPDVFLWLNSLPFCYRSGDFFFVHAGIKPGVTLDEQDPEDMLWIGDEFTRTAQEHEAIVVHGHTIVEHGPEFLKNRIGLDTGAYRTGRLSAVGFEESRQWVITSER